MLRLFSAICICECLCVFLLMPKSLNIPIYSFLFHFSKFKGECKASSCCRQRSLAHIHKRVYMDSRRLHALNKNLGVSFRFLTLCLVVFCFYFYTPNIF